MQLSPYPAPPGCQSLPAGTLPMHLYSCHHSESLSNQRSCDQACSTHSALRHISGLTSLMNTIMNSQLEHECRSGRACAGRGGHAGRSPAARCDRALLTSIHYSA